MDTIFQYAFKFFLVINPVAQAPFFVSLVKNLDPKRQQSILRRELLLAWASGLFFLLIGDPFLDLLHVSRSTVQIVGGLILVFIALDIIFPHGQLTRDPDSGSEPFLVPIAIPLLSGPALMTTLMLETQLEPNTFILAAALALAYVVTAAIVLGAPAVVRLLGKKGMAALEQLLGMLLIMLATEMVVSGLYRFIEELSVS